VIVNCEVGKSMYYVYVLLSSKTRQLYKGYTDNLSKRITKHNSGSVKTTKFGRPWKLIYYEAFINKTDALIEEMFLKTGKGRERLNFLLKNSKELSLDESAQG